MARPKTSILSRKLIVDKALDIINESGREALTLRRLARDLGVNPNSLYNHFNNLDDICDAIVKRIIGGMVTPMKKFDDWREYMTAAAMEFYEVILAHPNAIHLVAMRRDQHFIMPAYENSISLLTTQGIAPEVAFIVGEQLEALAIGAALLDPVDQNSRRLSDPGRYPSVINAANAAQKYSAKQKLLFGIKALLEGIGKVDVK